MYSPLFLPDHRRILNLEFNNRCL